MQTTTNTTTEIKLNGFTIVAAARPSHSPYVTVYAPNGTVALQTYSKNWYCDDVQELVAIGRKCVEGLCDFERLAFHQKAMVVGKSVGEVAKSFNIGVEVASAWKELASSFLDGALSTMSREQLVDKLNMTDSTLDRYIGFLQTGKWD